MKIKELALDNRPREKLIKSGSNHLSNEELMAILLGFGTRNLSAIELASKIINSVNSLKDLLDLSYHDLSKISGVKEGKACKLLAAFELAKRVYSAKKENVTFTTAQQIYEYMYPILVGQKVECFYALYLDVKCHLIEKRLITSGTLNSVLFDSKEVLKRALRNSSYAIVLVHNHPSGDCEPSKADVELTKNFFKAAQFLEIEFLDHVIIGDNNYSSMAAMNKLR